jgi:hypothetical protein
MTFSKIKGVAFVSIPLRAPFEGTILVDESLTPVDDVFSQCTLSLAASQTTNAAKPVDHPAITFAVNSRQPLTTVPDAIAVAQEAEHGGFLEFSHTFNTIQPIMPVSLVDNTRHRSSIALSRDELRH